MSQRECAGFSWPGFAVSADDPVDVGPKSTVAAVVGKSLPAPLRWRPIISLSAVRTPFSPSVDRVVGHDANSAWQVGHKVKPLPEVRSADPRSAQIRPCEGISQCFQVSLNSTEPQPSIRARNLLSKNDWRLTLADEGEPDGPEMARIARTFFSANNTERLTRAAAGPNRDFCRPSREVERVVPESNSSEGVETLGFPDCGRGEFVNVSFNDSPSSNVSGRDESSEPGAGTAVILVVDGLSVK